jgi:tRNA nucleotidyltransferase (CCA-adding enzyme)
VAPGTQYREDAHVEIPAPDALLEKARSLPAGWLLVERLRDHPGVHLVGGAVRDLLLDIRPSELDLVVEGDADAVVRRLGGQVTRHERFGTWAITVDGFCYDIAESRTETYAHPGALPEVARAPLTDDLLRRDFTVNAMAIALGGPRAGELSAAPNALEDLGQRRLRVLHDRSFIDDPTRLLRLVRYRTRLGFALAGRTAELASAAVDQHALSTVSGSRVGAELRLLAREPLPVAALAGLSELNLASAIHPDFGLAADDRALGQRALDLLPPDGRRDRLALAVATGRIPARELRDLLDRLAFEAADREAITAAATGARALARRLADAASPSQVGLAASGQPLEAIALAGALGPEEAARAWLEHLRHVALEVAGADLLEAGVPQGPAIGRGLRAALAAKLDGRASGPEAELAVALQAANETE